MISKLTGQTPNNGAETREEIWQLSMTSMRMVSINRQINQFGVSRPKRRLSMLESFFPSDFVSSYLRDLELPTWIGLSDQLVENQYAWSDGVSPVLYTNWNSNEPNNAGGTVSIAALTGLLHLH